MISYIQKHCTRIVFVSMSKMQKEKAEKHPRASLHGLSINDYLSLFKFLPDDSESSAGAEMMVMMVIRVMTRMRTRMIKLGRRHLGEN